MKRLLQLLTIAAILATALSTPTPVRANGGGPWPTTSCPATGCQ
jgi:hypothetical protein